MAIIFSSLMILLFLAVRGTSFTETVEREADKNRILTSEEEIPTARGNHALVCRL